MVENSHAGLGPEKMLLVRDMTVNALGRFVLEAEGSRSIKIVESSFEAAMAANIIITILPSCDFGL